MTDNFFITEIIHTKKEQATACSFYLITINFCVCRRPRG